MEKSTLLQEHEKAVQRIQNQVKHFHEAKKHFRVYHGSTSSTRPMEFKRDSVVDVSDMTRIFPVDKETMTVKAEPKVPMDELAAHTIKAGFVPKIVMEFKGITAGGGFSGMSGESSMYKYGLFQNTVPEIEIVLGDGTLETASRTHNEDLLREAGGSLGTFGIVTLITIELIPAKSHVEVSIQPVPDPMTIPSIFEEATTDPDVHYIDGVFFNKTSGVVMLGKLIDYSARSQNAILLKKKQVHWYADYIESHMAKHKNSTPPPVLLTLTDYLFRYDHGAFWGGKLAFQHFHVPQNRITRAIADPFLDSRTCYHALHKTGLADEYVVQDFGMPASTVTKFMEYVADTMPQCQMFLCPLMPAKDIGIDQRFNKAVKGVRDQRIFGVGVYGRGPRDSAKFRDLNRQLELQAAMLMGAKLLYARTYYTADEFWLMYDKEVYDEMRKKYKADGLPSVYDKLKADMSVRRKRRAVRGVLETMWDKAIGQRNYLLKN